MASSTRFTLLRPLLLGLGALCLMLGATAFPRGEASPADPPRRVAGVFIDEQAGLLSAPEELLLRHLANNMIPLPDTVRIRIDSVHYGVFSPLGGEIVLLSHDRFRAPNSLDRSPPYLYGRVTATAPRIGAPAPKYTHTLAHEVAHYLSRRLDDHTPRPAWGHAGTMTAVARAQEVEAEMIAAVLEHMAFGTRLSDLGYPDSVRIAGVGPRSTRHLLQEYRGIIADNWRLTAVGL